MLQSELATRLRVFFDNDTYYSDADISRSIQDGYDEVTAFSGCILKSAAVAVAAGVTYYDMIALLPDYIGVYGIFNRVTKRWLTPTSLRKLDGLGQDWETIVGPPEYFVPISHRYVAIARRPLEANYGNIWVYYVASAPTLGSSDTISIPPDHLSALEDYAKTDLWEQQQEFAKALEHFSVYQAGLSALALLVKGQRLPGRAQGLE